ncbi:methyltransferase domain-containing protein [bacterium]|nr:methyltransferase domain-containing protein [bacterium]
MLADNQAALVSAPIAEEPRRLKERVPHIEPLFEDGIFVEKYSRNMKRSAGPDFRPIVRYTLDQLRDVPQPHVLELGPGPGWVGITVAQKRQDAQVTGIDVSEAYTEIANQNARSMRLEQRVSFRQGDARSLHDFSDNSIDAVISNQSFHYWDPPAIVLNEIARVLKPGGVFCIGDDRRDLTPMASMIVAVTKWFMHPQIRRSWMSSIQGCYTADEVSSIFEQSDLKEFWELKLGARMFMARGRLATLD